ncbi:MAG: YihY/virulence factor BrkB family protein [Bacteroidales bacterium]|nr:YihY/virulence factor BrkB family protein [Bacteroidales bacterium]
MSIIRKYIDIIKSFVADLVDFFTVDLWKLDFSKPQEFSDRFHKWLRITFLTLYRFLTERIGRESVYLSYYTAMSVIPLLAIALYVLSRVGLDALLVEKLKPFLESIGNEQVSNLVFNSAENIIGLTGKGLFGILSIGTFIFVVVWLMISVENTICKIWDLTEKDRAHKSRKFVKSFGLDIAIMLLGPFIILMLLYGTAYYTSFIKEIEHYKVIGFIASKFYWIVNYGMVILVLSVMYKFIPKCKVHFGCCMRSALVTGIFFLIIQYVFLVVQVGVTRLNAVYGAIAAIPLFMVWMNWTWQCILFGAYLSYSYQNVDAPELYEWWQNNLAKRQAAKKSRKR